MVDAGNAITDVIDGNIQIMRQLEHRIRHRMAQPDSANVRKSFLDRPAIDCHRIHILQHHGVGAQFGHVLAQLPQKRHRAQPAHDPPDAECVGDGLAKAVFSGNLEIRDSAGLVATNLDRHDNEIGPVKSFTARCGGGHTGPDLQSVDDGVGDQFGLAKAFFIDIHQRDLGILQCRHQHGVAEKVPQENRRTGTDEGNLGHVSYPFCVISPLSPQG